MNHTPEPWHLPKGSTCMESNSGEVPRSEANARRIVACVNACATMPTDDLEEMVSVGGNIRNLAEFADHLRQQRDKLMAALEEAEKHMVEDWHLIDSDRGPLSTTVDEEPVIAMARAVIAEAKGESK